MDLIGRSRQKLNRPVYRASHIRIAIATTVSSSRCDTLAAPCPVIPELFIGRGFAQV